MSIRVVKVCGRLSPRRAKPNRSGGSRLAFKAFIAFKRPKNLATPLKNELPLLQYLKNYFPCFI